MSDYFKNKKVLVTGGDGFLGSYLVKRLVKSKAVVTVCGRKAKQNVVNIKTIIKDVDYKSLDCGNFEEALKICHGQEIVFNLASKVAGISFNQTHQADMLHQNLKIASAMTEAAARAGVEKLLIVSSACIYSDTVEIPMEEKNGFKDDPQEANAGYGWAKRIAEIYGRYYHKQYGLKTVIVRPFNAYGPGDHFKNNESHVIPGLISRVFSSENPIRVWGTGQQCRSFIHADDISRGMMLAIQYLEKPDPVNIGSDEEISIKHLIQKIMDMTKIRKKIEFDNTKPDGHLRRIADTNKARKLIHFESRISLNQGLLMTIDWYKKNYVEKYQRKRFG